jgi:hypothetical protein
MREREVMEEIGTTRTMTESEPASICVTFGVTWGKQTYCSASIFADRQPDFLRATTEAKALDGLTAQTGLRGNHLFKLGARGA